MSKAHQRNSRSEAARKAWRTRRAKARKRRNAALKAWRTRRLWAELGVND